MIGVIISTSTRASTSRVSLGLHSMTMSPGRMQVAVAVTPPIPATLPTV